MTFYFLHLFTIEGSPEALFAHLNPGISLDYLIHCASPSLSKMFNVQET